jgi:cytochrome c
MKARHERWYVLTCAAASVLVIAGGISLTVSRPAVATAQFAAETKLSCAACHTNPQGAGPLTPMGEKFKANGNKMPK